MSNSHLVSYTKISPFRNSPRNHVIDTITIHCYVGQASVESAGEWFQRANASCNYMIGADGRVALIVAEGDRSWCSANKANDNRAVTIECACDKTAPYAVNEKVYASLIALCTDICRRNGIKALLWKGDKSLIGKVDQQNMTVHCWFKNKACPGEYLYSRHRQIAAEVNSLLAENGTPVALGMTEKEIWNKLKGFGLNDYAAAAIMGHFFAESGLKANNLQNTFNTSLGMTDAEYTTAVDSGRYSNFVDDRAGYGFAQWTFWSRKEALLNFARAACRSIGDPDMQLEFFWKEIQSYRSVMDVLKNAASVLEASNAVLHGYEQPQDQSGAAEKKRASYGQGYFDKYADKTVQAEFPYQVRVKISDLYIRRGAGINYQKSGFTGKGVFTIVEEAEGQINSSGKLGRWGLLKSYKKERNGWICLSLGDSVTEKYVAGLL